MVTTCAGCGRIIWLETGPEPMWVMANSEWNCLKYGFRPAGLDEKRYMYGPHFPMMAPSIPEDRAIGICALYDRWFVRRFQGVAAMLVAQGFGRDV